MIRCAGGRAKFAINDIAVLNTLIGINEIVIVHHTGHTNINYLQFYTAGELIKTRLRPHSQNGRSDTREAPSSLTH